jgi:hypothetical protein
LALAAAIADDLTFSATNNSKSRKERKKEIREEEEAEMSRGDRDIVNGNLSKSMRENYDTLGVHTVSASQHMPTNDCLRLISTIPKWDRRIATHTFQAFNYASGSG